VRHIILCLLLVCTVPAEMDAQGSRDAERGQVVRKKTKHGDFVQYLPRTANDILVVVHGTPGDGENEMALADKFIRRWTKFADAHRVMVIAPAFDNPNFGSRDTADAPGVPTGGYRGLFGRVIGSDEFVHEILDQVKDRVPGYDGRFYLYGHSAGGQFASRYCVRHPDRLKGAILSAAGRFSYPDDAVPWPYGMRHTFATPNKNEPKVRIRINTDPEGWAKAATLPIVAIVGAADTEEQPTRPAHVGKTRIDLARSWVNAMTSYAKSKNLQPRIRLEIVPGVGHDSARLTPRCQELLAGMMKR
jgi:poly(3-hydroxybutyrate) depolymerase